MHTEADEVGAVPVESLRPYLSLIVLTFKAGDQAVALGVLRRKLLELSRKTAAGRDVALIANGVAEDSIQDVLRQVDDNFTIDAFVYRLDAPPSWIKSSTFRDSVHSLCIWTSRENYVAISCDKAIEERLQRWLDRPDQSTFKRVPAGTLNATLLSGEAKGLWLRGAHARRRTKADSKNLSGSSVGDALNPVEDSTYAMGSARAELDVDPAFTTLTGVVGTTPRRSKVWLKASESLLDYCMTCVDLMGALAATSAAGRSEDRPFPWLVSEVADLSLVSGAYDVTWRGIDDIPVTDQTDDLLDAIEVLERSTILVEANATGPGFTARVGMDGRIGGRVGCSVTQVGSSVSVRFGVAQSTTPTDQRLVRRVLDALECTQLLTLHYESGHSIIEDTIYSTAIEDQEFRSWQWKDFSSYNVHKEKPPATSGQDIHDAIGTPADKSLFTWVLRNVGQAGFLTCDDGAGEVADFVLLTDDDQLTLIHVKGASNDSALRGISAGSYEVVASQASKNYRYLDQDRLLAALKKSPVGKPATWYDGVREPDRTRMLMRLERRRRSAPTTVLIVQPHITARARAAALAPSAAPGELRRLRLVEAILNTTRGALVGQGSDLIAIGSK